ncbi:protein-disulfide reductase DsbD family protein [Sphingomonas sp. URHD0057]|uniref:protein-disulfide reductase DsbD family protein n=1 Tax=Sphingomonas sp. URHD0057 TaxID=1380389 RepID=UPI0005693AD1|nr:protein-disulfide reductase DsbD domain-containing protein [Sphingomonas sp. URHD0057]
MLRRFLVLIALLLLPAAAQSRGIEPELVAEGSAPAGGEVDLAIHMRTNPGWHGYWLNPGEAGLPMEVTWHLPPGVTAGPLRYPVPSRLTVADLMNYVYERDYAVLVRLRVPANARGTVPIRAEAHWLACTDRICVPEDGELALDLPIGTGAANRAQFDEWRKALPRPLATVGHFAVAGDKLRVAIPLPASVTVDRPYLFPEADGIVDYEAKQAFSRSGDLLIAELARKDAALKDFAGVVAIGGGRGLEFHAVPGAVPASGSPVGQLGWSAMWWALLGAIAGGILLNLMPCVFPILALKALHLSRAGASASEARRDALAYTAGAVVGTGGLGAVLLAIRAAGAEAGWAFQLQDPRTIVLLLLLAVAITANLLGLFELPVLGGRARPAGGFATGALAAFVATPCASPFLGAALGTALLLPVAGSVLVFAALGFGLAIPFLIVAFVPALRARLPKPGAWMKRLQRFLAIPMAASAVAALWLLDRQGGTNALLLGLAGTLGLCLLLFGVGQRQRDGASVFWAVPAALALAGLLFAVTPQRHSSAVRGESGAETWSEARVASNLQQGHPVFVYFTADWCLTCKVNEVGAIDRAEVREAFKNGGVTVLAGDWTDGDPAITRFLESRGRAGVPYYLWFAPGKQPEELPQVLTPSMLISRAQSPKR